MSDRELSPEEEAEITKAFVGFLDKVFGRVHFGITGWWALKVGGALFDMAQGWDILGVLFLLITWPITMCFTCPPLMLADVLLYPIRALLRLNPEQPNAWWFNDFRDNFLKDIKDD